MVTTHSNSHRRLSEFVDWIKPDPNMRGVIATQAGGIRSAISARAESDGLMILGTPDSGSFAKHTGLRRHMRGGHEIEGQDIDLPFIVNPATEDGKRINELLNRFLRYARACYPTTPSETTGSSVEMNFAASKLKYDLVPMLKAPMPNYQVILKKDGTRRLTSVTLHTEFVKKRTALSEQQPGRVRFNECVRLLKWWRCIRLTDARTIDKVRTILIELMCADAFDQLGVERTYTETLCRWFGYLANVTARRATIRFGDYASIEPVVESAVSNSLWWVGDPVNGTNNVVPADWKNIELTEFAGWFAAARDAFQRIVAFEAQGNDVVVRQLLADQFGSSILVERAAA